MRLRLFLNGERITHSRAQQGTQQRARDKARAGAGLYSRAFFFPFPNPGRSSCRSLLVSLLHCVSPRCCCVGCSLGASRWRLLRLFVFALRLRCSLPAVVVVVVFIFIFIPNAMFCFLPCCCFVADGGIEPRKKWWVVAQGNKPPPATLAADAKDISNLACSLSPSLSL